MKKRTRKIKRNQQSKHPGATNSFVKKFKETPPRVVLYNRLPTVPDELDWKVETFGIMSSSSATASISQTVYTNSLLHTADSFTSSGQNAALADVASTYTKYRIMGYKITYILSPRHSDDVNMTVIHSPTDPAFSSAVSWLASSVTRDKAVYHLVPASTKSPCIVHGSSSYSMSRIIGQKEYQQEINYSGTIDSAGVFTSPSDLTFLTFYQGTTGSFGANQACRISLTLHQYVKFYDKRQ